jgi:hypothetical protein
MRRELIDAAVDQMHNDAASLLVVADGRGTWGCFVHDTTALGRSFELRIGQVFIAVVHEYAPIG